MKNMPDDLRKTAEAMLNSSGPDVNKMSNEVMQKLFYEFQVHQIELELQNQALKASQHELAVSRDHYAHLYRTAPIGYLTLNEAGDILMANPAAARLLGTSQQVLTTKKLGQFINPFQQVAYHIFLRNILNQTREHLLIIQLQPINGNPVDLTCQGLQYCGCTPESCVYRDAFRYVELRGTVAIDANGDRQLLLSLYDLTEFRKSQEAIACLNAKLENKVFQQTRELGETNRQLLETIHQLKLFEHQISEREAKLNAIFNAAVEGIITMDTYGKIVSVNNTVESIFGYRKEELIGSDIRNLIVLKHHVRGTSFRLSRFIGKIKEVSGECKDGSLVPLELSLAKFFLEDKKYLAAIVRDISARKMQEQRDQQHLDELAHVTRLGLMGELASGIAHEVNQPLTAIVNYTEACLNLLQQGKDDSAQLQEILSKTSRQALKAGQIIHRMRNLIKARDIHRSTINMNELVNDAIDLCASHIKQNGIHIRLQLAKNLPEFCADSIQIEQVILNLLKNSIDALCTVPLSKPRKLSIETDIDSGSFVEIRVKDNGPGIEDSAQKNILTPFYTTKSEGMGMGLSICRSIIEAHGGMLRFNSRPEKGATFYFTLPVRRENNGN